jgi:YVTN family beta-propeller protein
MKKMRSSRLRKGFLLVVTLMLCALGVWAGETSDRFYILHNDFKVHSLSVVDAKTLAILGNFPLEQDTSQVLVDSDNRYLYVLHHGPSNKRGEITGPSRLTIHELSSQKLVSTIPVGYFAHMSFSGNRRYVLCFAKGVPQTKKQPEQKAMLTVVDLTTQKAVADLSLGHRGTMLVVNHDLSRMFVLTRGEQPFRKDPGSKAYLTAFDLNAEKPLKEIEFDGYPAQMALARDGKYLYLLDNGYRLRGKRVDGSLYVVDVNLVELTKTHDVGINPRMLQVDPDSEFVTLLGSSGKKDADGRFYQFQGSGLQKMFTVGSSPQFIGHVSGLPLRLLVTYDQLHFLAADGSPTTQTIFLNEKGGGEAGARLGGYPGEMLHLPEVNKLVMSVRQGGSFGTPTSKVAFVDLKENRVEHVVTTGRGSVKFGKIVGAAAASAAMTSLSYYAGYSGARATGSPFFFYNVYSFSPGTTNVELTTSADGKYVYALNTFSNDVTIIKADDATVIDHIAVGRGGGRVFRAPGGRFICAYTDAKVTLIDPTTNKVQVEHNVDGTLRQFITDDRQRRLMVLSTKALHVFSADEGKLVGSLEGLKNTTSLILPMQPSKAEEEEPESEPTEPAPEEE